jgi:hypothetical protein
MYSVTWIVGSKLNTVTHPDWCVIHDVYAALTQIGETARMWNPDKSLFDLREFLGIAV